MTQARPVRFGEFKLDPLKRELRKGDQLVPLQNRAFECMAYLLSNRDRAVGRDELIAAVWGSADVSDNLLDQMVLYARRAVGDTGRHRHVIRTIPHFGYSWIAPIDPAEDAAGPGERPDASAVVASTNTASATAAEIAREAGDVPPSQTRPAPIRSAGAAYARQYWPVLALLLLPLLASWFVRLRTPVRAPDSPVHMGLVLPVAVAADASTSWIRLGAMELIAERLRVDGQPVMPSDSVVALAKGIDTAAFDPPSAEAFAKTAGADLMISAVAESINGRWRVQLKTVHGRSPPLLAEAAAPEVLVAARVAADRMAEALGFTPKAETDDHPADEEMIRRAQAALLEDRLDEARGWLARIGQDSNQFSDARYLEGRIELKTGRYDEARTLFAAVADAQASADEPVSRARALYGIATAYFRQADLTSAARYFDESVALLDRNHGPEADGLLGRVLTLRGYNFFRMPNPVAADKDFMRARLLLESSADAIGLMQLDLDVGAAAVNSGRFTDAVPLLERAARRASAVHDVGSELRASVELARVRVELAEPASALALDKRLQELLALVQEPKLKRFVNAWRARIFAANGRLSDADDAISLALLNRAEDEGGTAPSIDARLAWARADFERAIADARASIAVPVEGQDPRDTAIAWLILLRSQLATGQIEAASSTAARAADWAKVVDFAPAGLYEKLIEAEFAVARHSDSASQSYREAWAIANEEQVPSDQLRVADSYVRYLIQTRDLATAAAVATRLAGWADRDYEAALLQLRVYHALHKPAAWSAALTQARALAGERAIPADLATLPPALGSL
jgi:DNA-binding winged helix-turn-helix (wHTH) protein/tetratricopeptide (TPR) repeat protein